MGRGFFVTGTDTEIGKTYITQLLLREFAANGLSVVGYKPVAAGAGWVDGALRNEDGEALLRASTPGLLYEEVNPVCLPLPLSPHLAALNHDVTLSVSELARKGVALAEKRDIVIAEGAGGWRVPLNAHEDVADLARQLFWPVILVVGIRLGCINHARLSLEAIRSDGLNVAGWVANCLIENEEESRANWRSIDARVGAPLLGVAPFKAGRIEWTETGSHWLENICK